jgi:polyhydroxyalkanoate synthesis regulator phasin
MDDSSSDAEARFRQAFDRLKAGNPRVLDRGAPVSQNNVAREAGCDPTALKKKRYPELVNDIQTHIKAKEDGAQSAAPSKQRARKTDQQKLEDMTRQRDQAQSILASANMRILELTEQVQDLQRRLDRTSTVRHLPASGPAPH